MIMQIVLLFESASISFRKREREREKGRLKTAEQTQVVTSSFDYPMVHNYPEKGGREREKREKG